MVRFFLLALLPLWLAGCAQWSGASWPGGGAPVGHYDFNWQLSGDPTVAPLQVFSGAGHTWLQFPPGRTPPALFAQTPAGLQPLSYKRQGPYVVVDGVWPALVLQGGRHTARVDRRADDSASRLATESTGAVVAVDPVPLAQQAGHDVIPRLASTPPDTFAHYRAGTSDATLRAVLSRWARDAGWLFEPQHWAVDADIPLAGTAEFPSDFKTAVRELLAATELADRPVQPCFYSNKVLRVVPLTQTCDRSLAVGVHS